MGNVSINLSLANIWQCWYLFKAGKRKSAEIDMFEYYLEKNLYNLYCELNNGNYKHGGYREFTVTDSKRRKISVAGIQDRIVHRLLYEYLVPIYDKTFDCDVWSCRKGKGLFKAIERTQILLKKYRKCFVWRADIRKFFDSVNHQVLKNILLRKIKCDRALILLYKVINSYSTGRIQRERES